MPEQTVIDTNAATQTAGENKQDESIISRVASFKVPEKTTQTDDVQFNPQDFEKISSIEEAKQYAQNAYKSFEKGFQKKFQDIAELRKAFESKVSESSSWTTERVQALLNDPSFVSAAQGMLGQTNQTSDESYSALTESEKKRIDAIEKQNQLLVQQQVLFLQKQQDEMLKQKYPNYNQEAVDTITAELLQGKVKNTREYIWRAKDYEDAVNRAYQMGRQDERKNIDVNVEGASYSGIETSTQAPIQREKGESNENLLRRLYTNALKTSRGIQR